MGKIKFDFSDEVVLITGAGQGIGEATAKAFADAGAKVILVDKDQDKIVRLKDELESKFGPGRFIGIQTDVSSPDSVQEMVEKSIAHFEKIDILFNNAGVARRGLIENATFEDYRYIMGVNLDGAFLVAHTVGKEMIKRKKGRIINNTSISGFVVNKGRQNGIYCASKAGLIMLTKALAVEWIKHNVVVNAIAPGYTRTPINAGMVDDPNLSKEFIETLPIGRFAQPEEMAAAVLYLAAQDTTFIIGETLRIDGGFSIW